MRAVNELLATIAAALVIGALVLVAANWTQTPASAPAGEARCVGTEDALGWVPLRCGNYQGYTSGWWYADWMN